jgi:hypothetical protein
MICGEKRCYHGMPATITAVTFASQLVNVLCHKKQCLLKMTDVSCINYKRKGGLPWSVAFAAACHIWPDDEASRMSELNTF